MEKKYRDIIDKLVDNIFQAKLEKNINDEDTFYLSCVLSTKMIKESFKPLFNEFILDLGGHNNSYYDGKTMSYLLSKDPKSHFVSNFYMGLDMHLYTVPLFAIKQFLKDEKIEQIKDSTYNNFMKFLESQYIKSYPQCTVCGATSKLFIDGNKISVFPPTKSSSKKLSSSISGCLFKNGITNFTLKANFKSGKLVFANNLMDLFDNDDSDIYITERSGFANDISSEYGAQLHQEYWNKRGLVYIMTSNTSPGIYKDSITGDMAIIEKYTMEKKDELEYIPVYPINVENMKYIDYICTDLWAVCAVDSSVIEEYALKNNLSYDDCLYEFKAFEVEIEPGEYLLTTYSAHKYSNRPVFLSMKKNN